MTISSKGFTQGALLLEGTTLYASLLLANAECFGIFFFARWVLTTQNIAYKKYYPPKLLFFKRKLALTVSLVHTVLKLP